MQKRPLSITIIAWVLIALTAFGLFAAFGMGSNPAMTKALEQMNMSLGMYQAWVVLGSIITVICAYGFLKGQPWSRVLYVVWGIIGLIVGFYTSPMKAELLISFLVLAVVVFFLFRENANDWFQARGFMLKRERAPGER